MKTKWQALYSDRQLWLALVAGPVFWFALGLATHVAFRPTRLAMKPADFAIVSLLYPVLEEIVFRGLLQGWLAKRMKHRSWHGLSGANITTSVIFSGLHFLHHPPLYAASVFVPSLVFGYFRERQHGLAAPIFLHAWYNGGYFWIFG